MQTDQPVLEFFPDADTAGYRLQDLGVYNWGTFHGKPFYVRPEGRTAILTGGNGTGKSTLADGLLTLLVPNQRRNYNQAGQMQKRSERNERDYVLGAYSEKHDESIGAGRKQYLRKDADSYSVLLATFRNEGLDAWVTLAQVLWVNTANKVDKVFVVEPRRLSIEGDFNNLDTPATIRRVLKDRGLSGLDSFTAYSDRFHDLLCMPKDKTPMEIFNQAICIKDITDLTSFIREHMLDDGGAAEKLQGLRNNFNELRETNRRIELATRQLAELELTFNDHEALLILLKERDELHTREQVLIPFFAEKEITLRSNAAEDMGRQRNIAASRQLEVQLNIEKLKEKLQSIHTALEQSDEGRRLREIENRLAAAGRERDLRKEKRRTFDQSLNAWNSGREVFDITTFNELQHQCRSESPTLKARVETIERKDLRDKLNEQSRITEQRDALELEQSSLLKRTSNIPGVSLRARAYIVEQLHLKPEDLPFVGELVQVKGAYSEWTGAIERLMHNFALCMVVRSELRERVDAFVNTYVQRGLVVYHAVPDEIGGVNSRLHAESVANKLELKTGLGQLGQWLSVELSHRFDHVCCGDTGPRFHEATNALTQSGLIKQKGSERRKDDRHDLKDATHYVLGWDNREKLIAIGVELKGLEAKLSQLASQIGQLEKERTELNKRITAAGKLADYYQAFSEIDWESLAKEIADLRSEEEEIKRGSDRLKELEREKNATKQSIKDTEALDRSLTGDLAVFDDRIRANEAGLTNARGVLSAIERLATQDPKALDFRSHYAAIERLLSFPLTSLDKLVEARQEVQESLKRSKAAVNRSFDERSQRIKARMMHFSSVAENIEFKDRLLGDYAIPGYNSSLYEPFGLVRGQLLEEDLPKNQQRFEALLHTTVTDDVTIFDELLETHAKKIEHKIRELNQQLHKIDFDRRDITYIQLIPTRTDQQDVKDFRSLRRFALQGSLNSSSEKESLKERYHRIEHLLNKLEENPDWTRKVIDVRNWFVFRADEYFRKDQAYKQSYSGASGKSGGEKNRLASTILATAIAYQYGISIGNRQTETFRLVAVDEMFSKTDDEFSEYLLQLFKEFHLQLLIIQPLDAKIHLVQKYVERYHVVTKRGTSSSVRTLTVQEYKDLRTSP